QLALVQAIFFGIKPAVLAIVVEALLRIGRRALKTRTSVVLAAAAFIAIFFLDLPFPLIVLGAGAIGFLPPRVPGARDPAAASEPGAVIDDLLDAGVPDHVKATPGRALRVLAVWLPLWLGPVAVLVIWLGRGNVFSQIAIFFSKMAVVTFGGAYAV